MPVPDKMVTFTEGPIERERERDQCSTAGSYLEVKT